MASEDNLTKLADDVRSIYRTDHVLTLGDLDSLAKQHRLQPHVVGDLINAMTTTGAAPGTRVLRPEFRMPGACPNLDEPGW